MSSKEHRRQWHPSVALDHFVVSIKVDFVDIVSMTKTPKLVLFDINTVKRAVGWGAFIEEVGCSYVENDLVMKSTLMTYDTPGISSAVCSFSGVVLLVRCC